MAHAKQGAKSVGIIMLVGIASKLLGFVREEVIAYRFGASYLSDAYYVATLIPLMLFTAVNGALRHTLIPVFVEYLHQKGKEEAFRFANNVFNVLTVILILLVVGGYYFSPFMIKAVAPGFNGQTYEVTVDLSKKLIIIILFLGLAGVANGILNSFKDFTIPAVTGLPQNIIIILAVVFLGETMGITGLAIGTVVGMASQLFLQLPALKKHGMSWSFKFELNHPGLKKVVYLVIPIFLGTSVNQINVIVDRMLASGLPEGSISALNFANRLSGLSLGIFTAAIATVLFSSLAEFAAKEDLNSFKESMFTGIKVIFLITVPVTVGLIILKEPIIKLLFQRGAFDSHDTWATAYALQFYSIGIVAISLRELLNKVYFSLQDTKLPVITGAIGLVINIVLNFALIGYLAHGGLALATSISAVVNVAIMFLYLPKRIGNLEYCRKLGLYLGKIFLAAGIMGVLTYWGNRLYPVEQGLLHQLIMVGGLILMGSTVYFVMVYFLKIEELHWLIKVIMGKLFRRRVYQVNFLPLDREGPIINPGLPLNLIEVNENNLRELRNFRSQVVLDQFKIMLAAGQIGFFAVHQDQVVHHSWVIINPSAEPLEGDHLKIPPQSAYIHYCSTREDLRGQGIFPRVLTNIAAHLKEHYGAFLEGIYIDAETVNQSSLKAIAKAGFEPYAIIKEWFFLASRKRRVKLLRGENTDGRI